MKKNFYWIACLLFWATLPQMAQAQEPEPEQAKEANIGTGWYRITMDEESLDILNDGKKNDKVRLAKTGKFTGQSWKFVPPEKGSNRYYLSTQWQGETKVLTLTTSQSKDGTFEATLVLTNKTKPTDPNATYQMWEIWTGDHLVQDGKDFYTINCTAGGPMAKLTYDKGKLKMEFQENPDATQIWTITPVK